MLRSDLWAMRVRATPAREVQCSHFRCAGTSPSEWAILEIKHVSLKIIALESEFQMIFNTVQLVTHLDLAHLQRIKYFNLGSDD